MDRTAQPLLLTVEVGGEPEYPTNRRVQVKSLPPNYMDKDKLDAMLNNYENELKRIRSHAPDAPGTDFGIETAEVQRNNLIDEVNRSYGQFLQYVQDQASRTSATHIPIKSVSSVEPFRGRIFDVEGLDVMPWSRKKQEIDMGAEGYRNKEQQYKEAVNNDLAKMTDTTVGTHLAGALNHLLDQNMELHFYEVGLLQKMYSHQDKLLHMIGNSYVTFYSWLLDQWNRNMENIGRTYEKIQGRVENMFDSKTVNSDLAQIVGRYETFLNQNWDTLPLEFRLSANPRKDWRHYLAQNQPEECVRLMKTELKSLENKVEVGTWLRELGHYDAERLQRVTDTRTRIKKRMEDAIDSETRKVYQDKWNYFTNYLYKMGIGLQQEASKRLNSANAIYQDRRDRINAKRDQLNNLIYNYEARLALVHRPWAQWLEKRKLAQKALFQQEIWGLAVDGLLNLYGIVRHLNTDFGNVRSP